MIIYVCILNFDATINIYPSELYSSFQAVCRMYIKP